MNPSSCSFAIIDAARPLQPTDAARPLQPIEAARPPQPQSRPQPTATHAVDDLASAASSICLAIQGTPSPEGGPIAKAGGAGRGGDES